MSAQTLTEIMILKFIVCRSNLLLYRDARCLCAFCGVKTRRDNLTPHCRKIHNTIPIALKYG